MGVKNLERPIHSLGSCLTHSATLAITQLAAIHQPSCYFAACIKSALQMCKANPYHHFVLLRLLCAVELATEVL